MDVSDPSDGGANLRRSGDVIFRLLTLIVILSPLPLGSIKPWAWSLEGLLVSALLLAWLARMYWEGKNQRVSLSAIRWAAYPYLAVLGWSLFQAYVPVPGFMAHPAWEEASKALGYPLKSRISSDPEATKSAFVNLACYGAVFYLFLQLTDDRKRAKSLYMTITGASAAYAIYGIIEYSSGGKSLLWYDLKEFTHGHAVRGTFVYKNAFATYTGLGLLCLLTLVSGKLAHMALSLQSRNMTTRERSEVYSQIFPHAMVFAVLFAALTLSMSRAGFILSCLAAGIYITYNARNLGWSFKSALIPLAALLISGLLYHFMAGAMERRFGLIEKDSESRENIYEMTIRGILDAPITGVGHGSFENNIKAYYPNGYTKNVNTAHNVYLEAAFELGIPAAALLCVSIFSIGSICARGATAKRTRLWSYGAAGVSSVTLIALHSWVDFSIQIPAVAITFAAITGAACARSLRHKTG